MTAQLHLFAPAAQLDLFDVVRPCNTAAIAVAGTAGEREIVAVGGRGARLDLATVHAAYNADKIAYGKPVTNPFRFRGELWISTSGGPHGEECYRIVERALFKGPGGCRPYSGEAFRHDLRDAFGAYHGMTTKFRGKDVVIVGPPVRFVEEIA